MLIGVVRIACYQFCCCTSHSRTSGISHSEQWYENAVCKWAVPTSLESCDARFYDNRQVPESLVRARQTRRIRDTTIELAWFSSASDKPIQLPPSLSVGTGISVNDIYIHTCGSSQQAWRCQATEPEVTWISLSEMDTLTWPGDHKLRQFIITEGGKPSLVVPGSVARRYKDKTH